MLPIARQLKHQWAKNRFCHLMGLLKEGHIRLIDGEELQDFGQPSNHHESSIILHVHDPRFYTLCCVQGSNGAAKAYINGYWSTPQLSQLLQLMIRNKQVHQAIDQQSSWRHMITNQIQNWSRRNTQRKAKRNIQAHYDLSNDFFFSFLDSTKQYSCCLYPTGKETLEQAAQLKLHRIASQLSLKQSDHVLEIGCGWGGLACYLAEQTGCRVTATTISEKQYAYCQQLFSARGLQDRITLLKKDYRQLDGQYDHIVSVEMIEAVGEKYLNSFCQQLQNLLKSNGRLMLQAILMNDDHYPQYCQQYEFIQKYVFPGGHLPSPTLLSRLLCEHSTLKLLNWHDIGIDYAQTLRHWRQHLQPTCIPEQYRADERLFRLWEYYFCYCEAGFQEKYITTVQALYEKK